MAKNKQQRKTISKPLRAMRGLHFSERMDPFIIAAVYVIFFLAIASLGDFTDWLSPKVKNLQKNAFYSLIRIDSADDTGVYMPLKSTVIDGDVDYINEPYWWNSVITNTGRVWNVSYQFGSSILWLPFFLVGHVLVYVMNLFGAGFKPDGYSAPYLVMTGIGSASYGCWGSIITYSIIRKFFRRAAALLVASSAVMISNLNYYAFVRSRKEHTSEYFSVALFFWVVFRFTDLKERTLPDYLFLGIAAGFMTLVRLNTIVFCIVPFVFFIQDIWKEMRVNGGQWKAMLGRYCAGLTCFFIALSPMFIHARLISGHLFFVGNVY